MKARSQEYPNCLPATLGCTSTPSTISTTPATMRFRGIVRQRDKSSGAAEDLGGVLMLLFQCGAKLLWHIIDRSEPGELKRAHISDNRPAILHGNVCRIGTHQVAAVADHEEQ